MKVRVDRVIAPFDTIPALIDKVIDPNLQSRCRISKFLVLASKFRLFRNSDDQGKAMLGCPLSFHRKCGRAKVYGTAPLNWYWKAAPAGRRGWLTLVDQG